MRLGALAILTATLAVAGPAAAQTTSSTPTDTSQSTTTTQSQVQPDAGSPSGTIYAIPLQSGRSDAAPRSPKPKHHRSTSHSNSGTSVKSDNGYSSSAHVPGAPAKHARHRKVRHAAAHKRKRHRVRRHAGGRGHRLELGAVPGGSGSGGGSHGDPPKGPVQAVPAALTEGPPTTFGTYLLVALLLAVAIATGVLASRAIGRRQASD